MKNYYTLYDSKAKVYNDPILFLNDEIARRAATMLTMEGDTDFHRFPGDFTLLRIGEYDDEKGEIIPLPVHEVVARLIDLKPLSTSDDE